MDKDHLRELLARVQRGEVRPEHAADQLASLTLQPVQDFAQVDGERALRQGVPEVVYGERKTPEQVAQIVARLQHIGQAVLVTRLSPEGAQAAQAVAPSGVYRPASRTFVALGASTPAPRGTVAIVAAGTADLPVAEEAAITATHVGADVRQITDVGVAGLHRLLRKLDEIRSADALVVVAGMEGALPSVVGGLVDKPIIGVPTSVGYGASLGGLAALFAMLNSCSSNVSVVNIDNGFAAGFQAALAARALHVARTGPRP